ncbi:S24/S26 family peptidase [Sphingobacterium rhinopitheci]|uniref:S24/S26 family peptidase n=1 Tax=Sphingobacterium rhinopitheci TaxID=2781960 RepID=UPI001F517446|nr:S24/S26 family peptidase [Sphingobacterium rhinopitheci]MCI0920749.1 S24/S26 family peptidase [Sphingobacterium rhinopitheci]
MEQQKVTNAIKLSNDILLGSVVELIKNGKHVKINISGSSMQPFLFDGDAILLTNISFSTIKLGDIILAKYNGAYVLHRVIRKKNSCVFIAGDNNLSQIEKIEAINILAIAVKLFRSNRVISLTSIYSRLLGVIWYCLRPLRKVYAKLFK